MKILWMTLFLFFTGIVSAFSQLKFHVADFAVDPFDLTARNDQYKKIDGSGALYAIIKVSGDDLKEYNFNFGNMNHLVESHEDQLWVYVQKNAKQVTISRNGYTSLRNYDFRTTIESGKTYRMQLSAQGPVIYTQMVMFQVKPADSKAVVTIKNASSDGEEIMLGMVDASGFVAKNLPYGTYTYRIISENYNYSEGRITLNNQNETYREEVTLRPRFSQITLTVDGGAEIWVNGEKKGLGSWSGPLNAGVYSVECRQMNHRSTTQSITVEENTPRTVALTPPAPIVGKLSLLTTPLGASIKIDGKDYGTTPRNITDIIIGKHEVIFTLNGYSENMSTVEIKEDETAELNVSLNDINSGFQKAKDLYDKKEYSQAVEIYQKLADQGSAEAQSELGWCYCQGEGVVQDIQKAVFWWEKSANQGNTVAQTRLGTCYIRGEGVWQDFQKAIYWLEKAANQGYAQAQNNLAWIYYVGRGSAEQDLDKALFWYEKAANQGYIEAQEILADFYTDGKGVQKDLQKAAYWYEKAANQGSTMAQFKLSLCYANGIGVPKNLQKAAYWYEKAANEGNYGDQSAIALYYYIGEGVEQDYKKAVFWWEKAANQGDASSQYNLGDRYANGEGVDRDPQKAAYWYEKAASQEMASAQCKLGFYYYNGNGVNKDVQKAVYWWEKAANLGYTEAQYIMGFCYYNGECVAKDSQKAVYWLEKAANQGGADAQCLLGYCYYNGDGVEKDIQKSFYWWEKAANLGLARAQQNLVECYENGIGVAKDLQKAAYWKKEYEENPNK